jgi:endo-alpha-1,4-polygalactosaminidase (GH114 family)
MRFTLTALCALLVAACGSVEGPLLRYVGEAADAAVDAGPEAGARIPIAKDAPWQYQLTGQVDVGIDADLFVLDLFNLEAPQIDELHARGKTVVAYLSAGTRETFRTDASAIPQRAIGNAHPDYPEEAWLDVRDQGVRSVMADRIALARDKGFDAVLPTNLSAYLHDSGFDLSADDQRAYNEWLAAEAHARGLWVGLTDFELAPQLAAHYDLAIHFACLADGNCAELDAFETQGKPVFDIETAGDATRVCAAAAAQDLNVLLKRPQFDAYRVGCL